MSINIHIIDLADCIYSFKVLYESPRRKPGWRFTAGVQYWCSSHRPGPAPANIGDLDHFKLFVEISCDIFSSFITLTVIYLYLSFIFCEYQLLVVLKVLLKYRV